MVTQRFRGKTVIEALSAKSLVEEKAASYTVKESDTGKTFIATAVDLVFTLPATKKGLVFTFVTKTLSAATGLSVSPAAADKIMGDGLTSADNKDYINTAASDREGDFVSLVGDGSDGWFIVAKEGTWAREA